MKTTIICIAVSFLYHLGSSEDAAGTGDLRVKFIVDALLPKTINSGRINLGYEFGGKPEDKSESTDCDKLLPTTSNGLKPTPKESITNYTSCDDVPTSEGSGVYMIKLKGIFKPVFCEIQDDSKYLVIQRRLNGEENFYRGWNDYEEGFGNLTDEFWIGNWVLNILTSGTPYKLLIELEAFDSTKVYARYESFSIDDRETKYKLNVSGYTGTAGDSLLAHNGQKFSTFDQDNDSDGSNCAVSYKGAWWYNKCHASNLNGLYHQGNHSSYADGINWHSFRGHHESMKKVVMKIFTRSPLPPKETPTETPAPQ